MSIQNRLDDCVEETPKRKKHKAMKPRPKAVLYKLSDPHVEPPVTDREPRKEKKQLPPRPYSDWKPIRKR